MFYVYRFLDEDFNVVYVGRTVDIQARMRQHFNGGHLDAKCYESVKRIDYLELKTKTDMKIKELYYIGKYRPVHNTADNHDVSFEMNELKDVWVSFSREDIESFFMEESKGVKEVKQKLDDSHQQVQSLVSELTEEKSRSSMLFERVKNLEERERELLAKANQNIILHIPSKNKGKFVRYSRIIKMLQHEPKLRGLRIVEGKLSTMLQASGGEIHAICGLDEEGENKRTVIMESSDSNRVFRMLPETERFLMQDGLSTGACEHWNLSWERKPYRKNEVEELKRYGTGISLPKRFQNSSKEVLQSLVEKW